MGECEHMSVWQQRLRASMAREDVAIAMVDADVRPESVVDLCFVARRAFKEDPNLDLSRPSGI